MAPTSECYTYRSGEKVALTKQPNQLVIRVLPEGVKDMSVIETEQVSSASTRVTCPI